MGIWADPKVGAARRPIASGGPRPVVSTLRMHRHRKIGSQRGRTFVGNSVVTPWVCIGRKSSRVRRGKANREAHCGDNDHCGGRNGYAKLHSMWHAVSSVSASYDPVVYEGPADETVVILDASPRAIEVRAWSDPKTFQEEPASHLEMRPGDQRAISGMLIRLRLKQQPPYPPPVRGQVPAQFASAAWRLEGAGGIGGPWRMPCPCCGGRP